jgi:hypothetical protein
MGGNTWDSSPPSPPSSRNAQRVILVRELVAGFVANSLALLSDAGHVFTDVLALSPKLVWYKTSHTSGYL